ncbi:MAG TPA: UDP-N-acetylmuramate--L-alanine ligase [Salinimicrobium sp.]|nr:UDP-N-acetylmuramate--L-alanine ligase [Salinimicrobium sp.]
MTEIKDIQKLFFIGIGGIGMSALARYFKSLGKYVAGYDKTPSALTAELQKEGITVIFETAVERIPAEIAEDPKALVVYTPAIPKNLPLTSFFREHGFVMEKRSEVLGRITKNIFTLAVAGTHGKTTTTAMLSHLLFQCGAEVTAFIGGISEDYNSNLILAGNKVVVVEADEYDRSFLRLSPNIAAITSMDSDHLDIYGGEKEMQDSFRDFAALLPKDGTLYYRNGLPLKGISAGIEDNNADISAQNIEIREGSYHFDLKTPKGIITGFSLRLPGKHNLLNAVIALAMALEYGISSEKLKAALAGFSGVRRRFTYRINTPDLVLIDDYAHHPAEIDAAYQAVREMHPGREVLVVFQPHLYSRTRDFAAEFARSLGKFDQVILLDIYPAREEPIEGIDSRWLLEQVKNGKKKLVTKEMLPGEVLNSGAKVVIMLGAGDIGEEVEKVRKALSGE